MKPRERPGVLRRRTRCVYCGQRIPGALTRAELARKHKLTPEFIRAARLTCHRHRRLPLVDPFYEYEFSNP